MMTERLRPVGRVLGLVLGAMFVASCQRGAAGWAGTTTDSAGITIVTNPAQGLWSDEERPVIEEQLKIGSAAGEPQYQFGQIAGLDVGEDGSIYVLDQQARSVRVFDAAGRFMREMGGSGSGPGEFSQLAMGLMLGPGDTVLVPDMMQQRVNRFTSDGASAGSFPIPFTDGISMRWEQTPDRRIVQQARVMSLPGQTQTVDPMDRLLVRTSDGTLVDTLLTFASGSTIQFQGAGAPRVRLFEPEPIWTIGLDGTVYFGMNSNFSIEVHSPTGELERIIRLPFERRPVTEADQQAFRELMRGMFERQGLPPQAWQMMEQNIGFAEHYPAFANLMGGPGNTLWVQRVRTAADAAASGRTFDPEEAGARVWDVFDRDGRYLGDISLPDRFAPLHVEGDNIYGLWRDELDVQYVIKLKVTGHLGGLVRVGFSGRWRDGRMTPGTGRARRTSARAARCTPPWA